MRALALLAWLAAAAAAAPAAAPPLNWSLQRAQVLTEDRKLLDALDTLLDALQRHPDSSELRVQLAGVSARLYDEERARSLTPEEVEQAVREAREAVKAGRREDQGVRRQIEAIRLSLESDASAELLTASRELGKLDRRRIEDQVLRQDMARYLRDLQAKLRGAVARGEFGRPKDQFVARGFIWYYQGDLEQALRLWNRALDLDPADGALREQAAWVERKLRQKQRRETIAKLLKLAQALYGQRRMDEALAQTRALKLLEPEDEEARMELQILEQKIQRAELELRVEKARTISEARYPLRAAQAWLEVLDLDPAHARAKAALQSIQERVAASPEPPPRSRRPERVEQDAAPAAPAPKTPRSTAEAEQRYALGLILYQQNDLGGAKKAMEAALRLDPELRAARISLDRINAELGAN